MCISKGMEIAGNISRDIFNKAEQADSNLVKRAGKLLKYFYVSYICQNGIGIILYVINGTPKPNEWYLQLQMR